MDLSIQMPQRHSIRWKDYDYSQAGAYFVTICTQGKMLLFENEEVRTVAERCWVEIPKHFHNVQLNEWIFMPNHLHGILMIIDKCGGKSYCADKPINIRRGVQLNAPTTRNSNKQYSAISPYRNTMPVIVRTYKAAVTTLCRRAGYGHFGWQCNYYEHVICNENDLNDVRQYIIYNSLQWDMDENNPNCHNGESKAGETICLTK